MRLRISCTNFLNTMIETGMLQGDIISPMLFNIFFEFLIRKVMGEADVNGIKLVFGSKDLFHMDQDKFGDLDVLVLMYVDDLVVISDEATHLTHFVKTFENSTQQFGLTMNVKKTCMMSLQQYKENNQRRTIREEITMPNFNTTIRNKNIDAVTDFTYPGYQHGQALRNFIFLHYNTCNLSLIIQNCAKFQTQTEVAWINHQQKF